MKVLEKILEEIERLDDPYFVGYIDRYKVKEIIRSHMNDGKESKMNDDLISRKAVLEILEKVFDEYRMSWSPGEKNGGFSSAVPKAINDLPIAYNVDAVCKALEDKSYWTQSTFDEDGYCNDDSEEVINIDIAIEIVRNRGKAGTMTGSL